MSHMLCSYVCEGTCIVIVKETVESPLAVLSNTVLKYIRAIDPAHYHISESPLAVLSNTVLKYIHEDIMP